jgi:hypothetical protein
VVVAAVSGFGRHGELGRRSQASDARAGRGGQAAFARAARRAASGACCCRAPVKCCPERRCRRDSAPTVHTPPPCPLRGQRAPPGAAHPCGAPARQMAWMEKGCAAASGESWNNATTRARSAQSALPAGGRVTRPQAWRISAWRGGRGEGGGGDGAGAGLRPAVHVLLGRYMRAGALLPKQLQLPKKRRLTVAARRPPGQGAPSPLQAASGRCAGCSPSPRPKSALCRLHMGASAQGRAQRRVARGVGQTLRLGPCAFQILRALLVTHPPTPHPPIYPHPPARPPAHPPTPHQWGGTPCGT